MGRTVVVKEVNRLAIPPGFFRELNTDLMEDLWFALAAAKHPELLSPSRDPPTLDQVLDTYLSEVTWQDFWRVFPYELREQGSCLDELDALGLLLAGPSSRARFQRHFEELAAANGGSSGTRAGIGDACGASVGPRPAGDGSGGRLPVRIAGGGGGQGGRQQQQQQQQPGRQAGAGSSAFMLRMSRALLTSLEQQQEQQHGRHLAYVSPVAPGRLQAAAHAPPPAAAPAQAAAATAGGGPLELGGGRLPPARQQQQQQQQRSAAQALQQARPDEGEAGAAPRLQAVAAAAEASDDAPPLLLPAGLPPGLDPAAASRLVAVAAAADAAAPGSSGAIAQETLAFAGISRAVLHNATLAAAAAAAAGGPGAGAGSDGAAEADVALDQPAAALLGGWAATAPEASATGAGAGDTSHNNVAPPTAPPAAAAAAAAAPPAAAAAGAAGAPARLTGQRRTWHEACGPDGAQQQQQQQQQQQGAGSSDGSDAAAAPADGDAAGGSGSGSGGDLTRVWRAVHEWLTAEDEDLLRVVSQVVPCRMAGCELRPEGDTRQQLRALAGSRRVPHKVVAAVADRLLQPCPAGEAQLVQLTASSGFSRSAAAAAGVLEACHRQGMVPVYINLAGLSSEDDVDTAVMRGLFGSAARSGGSGSGVQRAAAAAAAADAGADDGTAAAGRAQAHERGLEQQRQQQQQQQQIDMRVWGAIARPLAREAAPAAAAQDAQQGGPPAAAPAVAGEAAAGQQQQQQQGASAHASQFAFMLDHFLASGPRGAATASDNEGGDGDGMSDDDDEGADLDPGDDAWDDVAAAAGIGAAADVLLRRSSASPAQQQPVDQVSAHLTLLGHCCGRRQQLLLLLDEVDAAMVPEDGRVLRELLMRLAHHLPQAVVAMTSSSSLDAWRDAAVLRQVQTPLLLQLLDGQLLVTNHQLPRSPLGFIGAHCHYC